MSRRSLGPGLGFVAVGAGVVLLAVLLGTGRSPHPAAPEQAADSNAEPCSWPSPLDRCLACLSSPAVTASAGRGHA